MWSRTNTVIMLSQINICTVGTNACIDSGYFGMCKNAYIDSVNLEVDTNARRDSGHFGMVTYAYRDSGYFEMVTNAYIEWSRTHAYRLWTLTHKATAELSLNTHIKTARLERWSRCGLLTFVFGCNFRKPRHHQEQFKDASIQQNCALI
jgi:hypothetical protein